MKTLNWHTEEDPCLLFGIPVLPDESWDGGVYEQYDKWWPFSIFDDDGDEDYYGFFKKQYFECQVDMDEKERLRKISETKPVYPPAGWAGKTEDEIWLEMVRFGGEEFFWNTHSIDALGDVRVRFSSDVAIDLDATIDRLSSVRTLSRRLKDARLHEIDS